MNAPPNEVRRKESFFFERYFRVLEWNLEVCGRLKSDEIFFIHKVKGGKRVACHSGMIQIN